jgi:uncharacterized protein
MKTIRDTFTRMFGSSHNDKYAELLLALANTAVATASHFRATGGGDLKGIIDFEHKGDAIVDEIHELLDNSFIMRFDIPDAMRLTDEVDNVIDGMRKVAIHIDIYKPLFGKMRPDASELMQIGGQLVDGVRDLAAMLSEPRLSLAKVREVARAIHEGEAKADDLMAKAERALVAEYIAPGANRLEFIAWTKLYSLLEEITDDANHCANLVLSLARKEA